MRDATSDRAAAPGYARNQPAKRDLPLFLEIRRQCTRPPYAAAIPRDFATRDAERWDSYWEFQLADAWEAWVRFTRVLQIVVRKMKMM